MGQASSRAFTDSHVRKDFPDREFAISHLLRVAGSGRADQGYAYLWCPRPFPLGAVVTSAVLRVHSREPVGGSVTLAAHRVAERFTVHGATWADQPAVVSSGAASASKSSPPWDAPWELDVTAHMREIAAGAPWWGWRLSTSTAAALLRVYSDNDPGGLGPVLEVAWSDQPSPATGLSPSANRAVSSAKPTLTYVFNDVSGDTDLASARVQIHTEPTTTGAPEWAGEVAGPAPVIDLADTDYPGVPVGGSRWWRVSPRDGAGLDATWSDWAQWQRRAKPTVTITSPVDGSVVEDPTPTVTWSVSGGAQSAYQLTVWDGTRSRVLFTSGRVASSSARAVTLPAGVLARDDGRYFIDLRVWDSYARAPQPDDPPYVEVSSAVHFDRDGSLSPVTLGLVPTADQVGMQLTWTRDLDPGRWVILRDGEVVEVLDSEDVTSAPGWSWTDWAADPRRDHTWEVAPIVNGVAGKGTPVAGRLKPVGVWLVRAQTGERVMVTNDDTPTGWGMVEQSTSHLPLGARRPVLLTQGMGGYQGRTSGELTGMDHRGGASAQDQRDTFLSLKSRQGMTLRMVLADQNLPVTTWGMTVAPAPAGARLRFAVSWEWAQAAEFDYTPRYL